MLVRFFYTLILVLVSPFFLYSLYKKKPGKPSVGKRWKEHFGITPALETQQQPIWIHAVSVGEVLAVSPLIKRLKQKYPDQAIVLTTTTSTGAEQASKLNSLVEHRYMPLDFSFCVASFIKKINPSQLFIMETELWPNTLHSAANANLPITIINARLSQRSADRYAKVPTIFKLLSQHITQVLCQHIDDANRFITLGVNKDKIKVTGSIKFDIEITEQVKQQATSLRDKLGLQRPVWIAASTHQGEDEQVLEAHKLLLKQHSNALLILVPRHPERFDNVHTLASKEYCFNTIRRSDNQTVSVNTQVYLADTMGEMLMLLGAADLCFMGGSLIGDKVGGHNLLEPAALGIASITGPSYFNFTDITKQLCAADATTIVKDSEQLATTTAALFNDNMKRLTQGQSALKVVRSNQGAINQTLAEFNL